MTIGASMPINNAENFTKTMTVTDQGLDTLGKLLATQENAISARTKNGFFVEDSGDAKINLGVTKKLTEDFQTVRNEAQTVLNTTSPQIVESGSRVASPSWLKKTQPTEQEDKVEDTNSTSTVIPGLGY
jgi:hypothetical protein